MTKIHQLSRYKQNIECICTQKSSYLFTSVSFCSLIMLYSRDDSQMIYSFCTDILYIGMICRVDKNSKKMHSINTLLGRNKCIKSL